MHEVSKVQLKLSGMLLLCRAYIVHKMAFVRSVIRSQSVHNGFFSVCLNHANYANFL